MKECRDLIGPLPGYFSQILSISDKIQSHVYLFTRISHFYPLPGYLPNIFTAAETLAGKFQYDVTCAFYK